MSEHYARIKRVVGLGYFVDLPWYVGPFAGDKRLTGGGRERIIHLYEEVELEAMMRELARLDVAPIFEMEEVGS